MGKISSLVLMPLLVLALVQVWGSSWYVDDSVASSGDGKSLETAFKKVQEGINAASDGDTVIVAEGTYVENVKFNGRNIILTSTDPIDPQVVAATVIDGNQAGSVVTFSARENETCALSGFTVRNGRAPDGGGVRGQAWSSRGATIQYNVITGNEGLYEGGGLYGCHGKIQSNTIIGNSAGLEGGGLYYCHGTIQNNTIAENSASIGGGLCSCQGTIQDNTIAGNSASHDAGGLGDCDGTIQNNTISGNSAGRLGGGLGWCHKTIRNCIIWGNAAPQGAQLYGSATPTYSCTQDWSDGGEGNIADDPQFVDPGGADDKPETYEDNNYRLLADSPCIDVGRNEDWMWGAVDLDGNPRIFYGNKSLTVDMGAYEYGSWPFKVLEMNAPEGGQALLTWTSRVGDTYTVWSCADLSKGGWVEEASVASQGASTSWTDVSTVGGQKFYRIEMK